MRHSVLIPAYNAARHLPAALASLRTQTDPDWELIVVEDGSRDGAEDLVAGFARTVAQPVRYDNHGANRGVAATRTRLLELARGDLLSFLDADDWWAPGHLAAARQTLAAPPAGLAIARIQTIDLEKNLPLETHAPSAALLADPVAALFAASCIINSSAVTLTRGLASRVGPFDASFRIGEDRDYWLRCALAGARFADTGRLTCHYARHSASTMARTLLWAQQEVAFYEKHCALPQIPARERRRRLAHALRNQARLLRATDPGQSLRLLVRACRLTPLDPRPFLHLALTLARLRSVR
ncbi:glycosyltransferase family 2 protein [Termitidicoccus mucosus]|uniref:Glycosyltransferase 2-like domain-containing protein n=1 Tax=Termitidicoccus mucosus TaxID=1184151 RepID=A0A178IC64_9BACT|nr:hypothetical protein AW736_22175 [Opitutaceae bacterium TSB47]